MDDDIRRIALDLRSSVLCFAGDARIVCNVKAREIAALCDAVLNDQSNSTPDS